MAEIQNLMQPEVQEFILANTDADEQEIVLRQKSVHGVSPAALATQIAGRRKAREKLPLFYSTAGIIYPPSLNLEQCSSETTALIKQALITEILPPDKPRSGADLTGGFGVDSCYLSRGCVSFDYAEPNESLAAMARHNHRQLGNDVIRHHVTSAEAFIAGPQVFSFIYLDPSRRKADQKVFRFADCSPDAASMMPLLFDKTENVLVKTSPLMDLQQGIRDLKSVAKIIIIAVRNECREVLFLCQRNFSGEPEIRCVHIASGAQIDPFSFFSSQEKNADARLADPENYLYEPNAAILKSGAFKLAGQKFGLAKLAAHTHLYTSNALVHDFPGRIFEIESLQPDLSHAGNYFPDSKANILTRNYPLPPDELKKKYKLKDGGEKYLLGFSGQTAKFTAVARRIK